MAKIFSILTIIVAAVAAFLGFESQKLVAELQKKGEGHYNELLRTQASLKKTIDELVATQTELANTKAELEQTKEKLRMTEEELTKTKTELTTTKSELDKVNMQLVDIQKAIEEVLPEGLGGIPKLKETIINLTTKTKEQEMAIVELEKQKADLEGKVANLEETRKSNEEKIEKQGTVIKRYTDNIMQKGIYGRVMAVNAGWGFCVVSLGDKSGAANNKVLIVARDGRAIGKVKITNVEATQSVADILPNTFLKGMFIQPGDTVIYTGEDKVKIDGDIAAAAGIAPALPQ